MLQLCADGAVFAADPLLQGFANPPATARPRVWWHWMNGNVTKDGIAKDLDWLQQIGVAGVQNFDANLATPQIVPERLVYMTPPWKDAFRFAVEHAEAKGLEFAIAASPGWSETGGPWVPPADGLKKIVWSEQFAQGGVRFAGRLPALPSTSGPFQDIEVVDALASLTGAKHVDPPRHVEDIAVFAVPLVHPAGEGLPRVVSGDGTVLDAALLADGQYAATVNVARNRDAQPVLIDLTYTEPRQIRSVTFFLEGAAPMFGNPEFLPVLQAKQGGEWQAIANLPLTQAPTTRGFEVVTAREFRVVMAANTGLFRIGSGDGVPGAVVLGRPTAGSVQGPPLRVGELRLDAEPRVDRFETKAGFSLALDYHALPTMQGEGVPPARVIDLTGRMKADGQLDWTPPPGRWRILRMGYSLLGTTNHPATPEATGLEVDKFDGAAVRRYLETYLAMYRDTVGDANFGQRGLRALLTDSIEVGAANWTPRLLEQFKARRGYDARPWLPALAGTILESRAKTDAFLYDYRQTLAELMASEHYGTVATVAHEQGLAVYGEALEDVRPSLGDDMAMRAHADIPMAALWTWQRSAAPKPTALGDMKGASSVAHLYGRPFVAAESMTSSSSPWAFAPSELRRIIDLEFAYGINRPVIHTSVHQPVDDKVPGLSLSIFGQYFNRHETWAPMAKPWIDYLARTAFLLQQGVNVADVAYFYGEEQPLTALYAHRPLADLPKSNAFDFVNADALLNAVRVEAGEIVSVGGARYRVLYLGASSRYMSLAVLKRIERLVLDGATVIGLPPTASPGLGDNPAEFRRTVHGLWPEKGEARVGKGRVIAASTVDAGLLAAGIAPDFRYTADSSDAELLFVHRRIAGGDVYFLNNRRNRPEQVTARFRSTGKRTEIWRADSGTVESASHRQEAGETVVSLKLDAEESFFVVLRDEALASPTARTAPTLKPLAPLSGSWGVSFQAGRGAPEKAQMDRLQPLDESPLAGIRYFSGIATYTTTFSLPAGMKPGDALSLDLGEVGEVAEVRVNGRLVGTAWHAPYRLDISSAIQLGQNVLEVRVANLWVNRLIGDAQPGATRLTFTALPTYRPDAPLRRSGLIGPVRLLAP